MLAGSQTAALADDWNHKEDFRQTFQQGPGGRLEVSSFNGSVEVVGWDQGTVEVTGTKYAKEQGDLFLIRVEIAQSGNMVIAKATRDDGRKCNNCGARFIIRVPRRTDLGRIRSSNGTVRIENIEGPADASTSNGTIRLVQVRGRATAHTSNGTVELTSIEGDVSARTSNGTIKVDGVRGSLEAITSNGTIRGRLTETGSLPVKLTTSNGTIDILLDGTRTGDIIASSSNGSLIIRMPNGAGARVDATTSSHDSIQTDFDVQVRGMLSKGRLQGTIGSGGPLLQLNTSNGAIRILRAN